MQEEPDPMQDREAQNDLIQLWIDELQSLPRRDDGTVEFTDEPWIVNVTTNAQLRGAPRLHSRVPYGMHGSTTREET